MKAVNTCHKILYFFDENRNQHGVAIVNKISVSILAFGETICVKVKHRNLHLLG